MADQKKNQSGGFNPIGLCIGLGIGLCFGTAMGNMGTGICLGLGVGLCFCVALGHAGSSGEKEDASDDKRDEGFGDTTSDGNREEQE